MDELYRCERLLQFAVLGLKESQEVLDENRLMRIIHEAKSFLSSPSETEASSNLFSTPALQLTSAQATILVAGDCQNPVISIRKEQTVLLELPVSSVRKVSRAAGNNNHVIIVADTGALGNKFIPNGTKQLVVSLILPSQRQTETLIELLDFLRSVSPLGSPDSRYLVMSKPEYEDSDVEEPHLVPRVGIYDPSTFVTARSDSGSSKYDYEASTQACNIKSVVEMSKMLESEKAFVAQLEQCIGKIMWPVEIREKMKRIVTLHKSICSLLDTDNTRSLISCLKENLTIVKEHGIFFDHVSVYGTRSPDLKVEIVTRLCSLRMFLDADAEASGEKAEVIEVLNETVRRISDRQILLQIDQDKFNVMQCGEVMHQGRLIQLIKKKPTQVYSILTRDMLILTSPTYLYLTHVLTEKMTSAVPYKESNVEFIITLDAKVSEKKLQLKANDSNSMRTWLNCLHYIIKQTVDLYF